MKSKESIKDERKILTIIAIIVICSLIALFYILFYTVAQTAQNKEANIDFATYAE